MMIIPLATFVMVAFLTGSTWRFALILLLLGPLMAATLWTIGEMLGATFIYRDVPLTAWWIAPSFGLIWVLPTILYPPSAWLGAWNLAVWAAGRCWFSMESFGTARRVSLGAIIGTALGLVFAGLVIESFFATQFNLQFGKIISMRSEFDQYPFVDYHTARVSVVLGLVDGLLVAWKMKGSDVEHPVPIAVISTESN